MTVDKSFLENKNLILGTVTGNTVNFLTLYNELNPNFNIKAILDVTLPYRKNIDSMIRKVSKNIPILTSLKELNGIISDNDIYIEFESAQPSELFNQIEFFDSEKFSIEEFENKVKSDYDNYIENVGGNEFTFVLRPRLEAFRNRYIFNNFNVYMGSALNYPLWIFDNYDDKNFEKAIESRILKFEDNSKDFDDLSPSGYFNKNNAWRQKPIFVMGSDFAIGKTKYCLSKMSNDSIIVSPDIYVSFFENTMTYDNSSNSVGRQIYQCLIKNYLKYKKQPYIKIEGSIIGNSFSFLKHDVIFDVNFLDNVHNFYEDYEFHIIIKENEKNTERLKNILNFFCQRNFIDKSKVRFIVSVKHSESFKDVTSEIDF